LTTSLTIPITTTPVAALLAAAGVAQWMVNTARDINGGELIPVSLRAAGHSFVVTTPLVFTAEQAALHYQPPDCQWILTAKNGPAPTGLNIIDYEDEKQHNADYYEGIKRLQKLGKSIRALPDDERIAIENSAPREFWPVAALINQMGALSAYNKAIERWAACKPVYSDLVAIIMTMCSGRPGAIEQAEEAWAKLAKQHSGLDKNPLLSATQIVNPEQGKGANRAKADALTIGGQESFWLLEYFKYAGLLRAALPRMVQSAKDRKTYVVLPSSEGVEIGWYDRVFRQFQKELWASSSVKMDILAVLRYTNLVLQDWEGAQRSSGRRRSPADYVEGLITVSYKDLGSAYAVMNVATLNLPDWIDQPYDANHAQRLGETVLNHVLMINALEEKKSEEEQLLRNYRDFLSSHDPTLTAFFAFTTGYAAHAMRKMSKRQRVRRLTIDNLKEIIMSNERRRVHEELPPLKNLFENQGFRNIATAIRQSTVTQQYFKTEHDDTTYEVRYGLADELQRHSRDKREFLQALDSFLIDFLKENARVMERNKDKKYRKRIPISSQDIAHVAALTDLYGAPTVANTLIACGYARDARDKDDADAAISEGDDAPPQIDDSDNQDIPF
jgi:hypothetical protein